MLVAPSSAAVREVEQTLSIVVAPDLCRLTVATPVRTVELALPVDVPLVSLLPAVLRFGGRELADRGLTHDGWVLQRLGEPPLAQTATLSELDVHDGDTLYLRPRRAAAPEAVYDDLADGLASATKERADPLRAFAASALGPLLGGLTLAAGLVLLVSSPDTPPRWTLGAASAVLLLAGAFVTARALGRPLAAVTMAFGAIGFAAASGALLPLRADTASAGGIRLLSAGAAALLVGALGRGACGAGWTPRAGGGVSGSFDTAGGLGGSAAGAGSEPDTDTDAGTGNDGGGTAPLFLGASCVGGAAIVGGLIALATSGSLVKAAAGVAVLAVVSALLVPWLAFRLAGGRLAVLPTNATELRQDAPPIRQRALWRTSAAIDGVVTALLSAAGVVCLACGVLLAGAHGAAPALAVAVNVVLLLRTRAFSRGAARLATVLPGCCGLAVVIVLGSLGRWHGQHGHGAAIALAVLVVAGFAVAAFAPHDAGRRVRPPHWARAGDIVEYLAAIGLVPLLLAVLGVFGQVRGLSG
jgi:type VII secretion integral membrane protein EccD